MQKNQATLMLLITGILVSLTLSGCKRILNVEVSSHYHFPVKVVSIMAISLNGVHQEDAHLMGTLAADSRNTYENVLLDEGQYFILQIQDSSGHTIGTVKQSRSQVHEHLEDRTWRVVVPEDVSAN